MARCLGVCFVLIGLLALTSILEVSARKHHKHHCPKKSFKFDRRIKKCYSPLSETHESTNPQYCLDYRRILKCVNKMVHRCKHRHWMRNKMQDMDNRVAQLTRMINNTC